MPTAYRSQNVPLPIPVLSVTISAADEKPWLGPLNAIVDSGADMTLFPLPLLYTAKAHAVGTGKLRSAWGEVYPVRVYTIEL